MVDTSAKSSADPRSNLEPRKDLRAEDERVGWSTPLLAPGPRPRPSVGERLASLRDQLNGRGQGTELGCDTKINRSNLISALLFMKYLSQ